jgi:hypothetical protein
VLRLDRRQVGDQSNRIRGALSIATGTDCVGIFEGGCFSVRAHLMRLAAAVAAVVTVVTVGGAGWKFC